MDGWQREIQPLRRRRAGRPLIRDSFASESELEPIRREKGSRLPCPVVRGREGRELERPREEEASSKIRQECSLKKGMAGTERRDDVCTQLCIQPRSPLPSFRPSFLPPFPPFPERRIRGR